MSRNAVPLSVGSAIKNIDVNSGPLSAKIAARGARSSPPSPLFYPRPDKSHVEDSRGPRLSPALFSLSFLFYPILPFPFPRHFFHCNFEQNLSFLPFFPLPISDNRIPHVVHFPFF